MWQYAASRALALRSGADLQLDTWSGFARDRVYRRNYELASFPLRARTSPASARAAFWYERLREKFGGPPKGLLTERPWGLYIRETAHRYYPELTVLRTNDSVWLNGHWQFEPYFEEFSSTIADELSPPLPSDRRFLEAADRIDAVNAVAVGVRLYEEIPGAKATVGGVTDAEFYEQAAAKIATAVVDPVFFVFSSTMNDFVRAMKLPGRVEYLTGDNGYGDAVGSLWLMKRCNHHIISNSSLYWWGAWFAERRQPSSRIIASNRFANPATIPARWKIWSPDA